jgi:hypothetical protein
MKFTTVDEAFLEMIGIMLVILAITSLGIFIFA